MTQERLEQVIRDISEQLDYLKSEYGDAKELMSQKNWDYQTGILLTGEEAEEILDILRNQSLKYGKP